MIPKINGIKNGAKAMKWSVSVLYLLLLILPHGYAWHEGDTEATSKWISFHIWDDELTFLFYLSFAPLWIAYLLLKNGIAKQLIALAMLLIAGCYALFSLSNMAFIAQDFQPHICSCLDLLLFPCVLYVSITKPRSHTQQSHPA
jgi:hypothetical protein